MKTAASGFSVASFILVSITLVLAGFFLDVYPAAAEPRMTQVSLRERLTWDKWHCESQDGTNGSPGKLSVSVGTLSVETKCEGGGNDGRTCTHTFSTEDCRVSLTRDPEGPSPGIPTSADPGENPRSQTSVPGDITAPTDGQVEDLIRGEVVSTSTRATDEEVVLACESLGGIATVVTNGSIAATEVHCRGGVLDGSTCIVGHYDTYCTFFRVTTDVTFTDGRAPGSMADVLQNVDGSGKVVVMNQSGDNVENVKNQVAACRALGGVSDPIYDFDPDGTAGLSEATCKGGLLNGLFCFNTPSETVCIFMRAALPESVQVEPSGGNQVPAENVPVAPSPTVVPTGTVELIPTLTPEPTPMSTTEPTMVPTDPVDPPTFPTPPTDDVVVPPGEAEDPVVEPTLTEVVLT